MANVKIKNFKNTNITLIFSVPLNHLLITQSALFKLFSTGDAQKDTNNFIEAPGLKVMIFPSQGKEFVFESNRLLINDKSDSAVISSSLIPGFQKILDSGMVDTKDIVAYGFNYDIAIALDENTVATFLNPKIVKSLDIKSAGISVTFNREGTEYKLQIAPSGQGNDFIAHLNVQYNAHSLPDALALQKDFEAQSEMFKKIINETL